jgi:tetratricopeptide (TPR) repeat protein
LEKAQSHYQLCATYAKGIQNDTLTAMGYFLASWISYVRGEVQQAIELGEKSIEFAPKAIPEAYYNLAKYHAHEAEAEQALLYLKKAIQEFDPYYAVKANLDPDFEEIQAARDAFFEQLKKEEVEYWQQRLSGLTG